MFTTTRTRSHRFAAGAAVLGMIFTFGFPALSSALTLDDVQGQIQELLAKIQDLTKQLNDLRMRTGQQTPWGQASTTLPTSVFVANSPRPLCAFLYRNIVLGAQGDDVKDIQELLKEKGFLNTEATGYFGSMTRDALARLQASEGIITQADASATTGGAGTMGPKTRAYFQKWCGNPQPGERFVATPTQGVAPLTVNFSTWLSGFHLAEISFSIDYGDGASEPATPCNSPADACIEPGHNTHTYIAEGTYIATLVKTTDPCMGNEMCKAAIQREVVAKQLIKVGSSSISCTKEYKPVCGLKQVVCIKAPCNPVPQTYGNTCMLKADGASFAYEGACRTQSTDPSADPQCKSWFDGCNTCSRSEPNGPAACTLRACLDNSAQKAYCSARFDTSSVNKPPVISSLSGPTTLTVNEQGTWSVEASDPENGSLSYRIIWGDDYVAPLALYSGASQDVFVQSTTFTHSYAKAGVYTVVVIVQDETGLQAKTSTTVRVGSDAPIACTMEYNPVCGRPSGCSNTCPAGMYCAALCRMPDPQTYSNTCFLKAAQAELIHSGACTDTDSI